MKFPLSIFSFDHGGVEENIAESPFAVAAPRRDEPPV
jgi:hypothetical protein